MSLGRVPLAAAICRNCLRPIPSRAQPVLRTSNVQYRSQLLLSRTQARHRSSMRDTLRTTYRSSPYLFTLGIVCVSAGAGLLAFTNYYYSRYITPAISPFPAPVAKELRRALWYTNLDLQPKEALKHYRRAMEKATELGMDPFSNEVLGIKIMTAKMFENAELYKNSIELLELTKRDVLKWIEVRGEQDPARRARLLALAVSISVKVGNLYASDLVQEPALAEERLVWAVETMLKERRRLESDNKDVPAGEKAEWMSDEEVGGTLEALGDQYEAQNKHHYAAPLYLQCLALVPKDNCHSVILMNNLATSIAQQNPPMPPGSPRPPRKALVASARSWAEKALDIASVIKPPERNEECDIGCAVATHNLGEFAEMDGNIAEARRRYDEALSLAQAIGFQEGVIGAKEGLKRVDKAAAKK